MLGDAHSVEQAINVCKTNRGVRQRKNNFYASEEKKKKKINAMRKGFILPTCHSIYDTLSFPEQLR